MGGIQAKWLANHRRSCSGVVRRDTLGTRQSVTEPHHTQEVVLTVRAKRFSRGLTILQHFSQVLQDRLTVGIHQRCLPVVQRSKHGVARKGTTGKHPQKKERHHEAPGVPTALEGEFLKASTIWQPSFPKLPSKHLNGTQHK